MGEMRTRSLDQKQFVFPEFWNYPPYFTLQPISETQQKQKDLWRGLILSYCRHHRIFVLATDDSQDFPPFANAEINRHLSRDAKLVLLDDLVQRGSGEWLDGKRRSSCLVLWRTPAEWAEALYSWAVGAGLREGVVTMDELQRGDDVRGSELEEVHREVLLRAIRLLEVQGRAKLFRGAAQDDEGVKFF